MIFLKNMPPILNGMFFDIHVKANNCVIANDVDRADRKRFNSLKLHVEAD